MQPPLTLASSSPYRRRMLAQIGLDFTCQSPDVDETPLPGERAEALVARLALAKAKAVAHSHADGLIIGADQVADVSGEIVGKPAHHADALEQLRRMSGAVITLYSGLTLVNAADGRTQSAVEPYEVAFHAFSVEEAERYLQVEQPYQCCGSLKAEGAGIALIKHMRGDDPNALLGLPVIRLVEMLKNEGVELF